MDTEESLRWAVELDHSIKGERPLGPTGKPITCDTAWFTTNNTTTGYSYGAYKFTPTAMTVPLEVMTKVVTQATGDNGNRPDSLVANMYLTAHDSIPFPFGW